MHERLYWVCSETHFHRTTRPDCRRGRWRVTLVPPAFRNSVTSGCSHQEGVQAEPVCGRCPGSFTSSRQTWACNLGNWLTLILFCHWAWAKMVAGLADAGLQTSAPTSPFPFPNAASRSQSGESWLKWTAGSEAVVERTIPSKRELAGLLIYVLWSYSEKQNKFFYLWL